MLRLIGFLIAISTLAWATDVPIRSAGDPHRIMGASPTTGAPTKFLYIFDEGALACRIGDSSGNLFTSHLVSGTDRAQDVDVRHSALPDGAATEATLASLLGIATSIDGSIDVDLSTRASEATLAAFQSANHTDLLGIQTRQDSTNTKLDTVNSNLITIQAKQDTGNASLASIDSDFDVALSTRASESTLSSFKSANHTDLTLIDSDLLAFKSANHTDLLGVQTRQDTTNTSIGATNESAAATDVSTSGLNGLTKRLNQHQTTIEGKLDTVNSNLVTIQGKQDTGNASLASIDSKVSTAANQTTLNTRVGDLTETAPATDTASSGLNGRLQRIAQRLTTLIAFFNLDFGASSGAIRTAAQVGNATGAASFNSGATGAQTLRTAANLYDSAGNAVTTRSYDSVRPVDTYSTQIGASNATHTRTTLTANTSTQIAAANSARKWLYIENQSGANVFIKFGATAVVNQAIEISNGTTFKMSATELYLGAINVIVGSNNRTIEVVEGY